VPVASRRAAPRLSLRLFVVAVSFTLGCFDVGGEPAGPPSGDSGANVDSMVSTDSATPTDSTTRDTGRPPGDTGVADTGVADTGVADTGVADTGPAASCPDVYGAFSITAMGIGCGDLDTGAAQRIDGDRMACVATFSSTGGLNGTGTVSATGALSGASLSLGTAAPTSCSGTWTAATSSWMLQCGAAGPSRCNVQLVRSGP